MDAPTYSESELIINRAPVLLSGGAAPDRAGWAQEAAEVGARPLVTVTRSEQLGPALVMRSAVLFVPDILALGDDRAGHAVRGAHECRLSGRVSTWRSKRLSGTNQTAATTT